MRVEACAIRKDRYHIIGYHAQSLINPMDVDCQECHSEYAVENFRKNRYFPSRIAEIYHWVVLSQNTFADILLLIWRQKSDSRMRTNSIFIGMSMLWTRTLTSVVMEKQPISPGDWSELMENSRTTNCQFRRRLYIMIWATVNFNFIKEQLLFQSLTSHQMLQTAVVDFLKHQLIKLPWKENGTANRYIKWVWSEKYQNLYLSHTQKNKMLYHCCCMAILPFIKDKVNQMYPYITIWDPRQVWWASSMYAYCICP